MSTPPGRGRIPEAALRHAVRARLPAWIPPMLATLVREPFSDPAWIFERKLDGERCLVRVAKGRVRLYSRSRRPLTRRYPEIAAALRGVTPEDCYLDGEIVARRGSKESFALLQRRMQLRDPARAKATGVRVELHLFDVLHVAAWSLVEVPQLLRKRALRRLVCFGGAVRYVPHRLTHGERLLPQACARGWEGLVAKHVRAPYQPGIRSLDWLKLKCTAEQELVIGGFTEPRGARAGFGALLVGYYDARRKLRYAGKVGTGFDDTTLLTLRRELERLEQRQPPFVPERDLPRAGVHWVRPALVAQVAFSEWTPAGRLRHPRFLGLRRDKPAREVVREVPRA